MSVVIVGAGQSAAWVARTLRDRAYAGPIVLIGQEPHAPYERPTLSKGLLAGTQSAPPVLLSADECASMHITFVPGTEVTAVERSRKAVICADGRKFDYDTLVLATGGRARMLPAEQADLPGVFTLRTLEDCHAISTRLTPGKRLLVIGGGWIGLEVGATAALKGVAVTVLEAGERLCARSVPPLLSQFLLERHRNNGVEVRLGASLRSILLEHTGHLAVDIDGTVGLFDVVVVGIGMMPNTSLALECGLEIADGIVVDKQGRTTRDPDIFATGDVINQPCSWAGGRIRLESWANAQTHAISVGRVIAGGQIEHDEIPWFWSDQYDFHLQVLGVPSPDAQDVIRGNPSDGNFSVFQLLHGKLRSVLSVNSPRDVSIAKRWMKRGECPEPDVLADTRQRLDRIQ